MSLTEQEISTLLRDLESELVERKASLSDKDRICQAICAFANDLPNHRQPGIIVIGVNNDGSCANLSIDDDLLLQLSSIRSDGNILPLPNLNVEKLNVAGCDMAVVTVQTSTLTPVRYRGIIWIRVGSRRGIASLDEERRLNEKRRAFEQPFDLRPILDADMDILDLDYFKNTYLSNAFATEILSKNTRDLNHQLVSLRFAVEYDNKIHPTVLGDITLGRDVLYHLPGAYIQFIRLDGKDLTSPIKNERRMIGKIADIIRLLDELLAINLSTRVDFTSQPTEIRSPDYPIEALQQITRNALLHRTYEGSNSPVKIHWFSDRIEIINPGGVFGAVTKDNFGKEGVVDYRNPNLADVMKTLGYVQRFGFGIPKAREALRHNGNPDIEFDVQDSFIAATIRASG